MELESMSHFIQNKSTNSRGFVYNQRTRDQLLTSLYQIIKEKVDMSRIKEKKSNIVSLHSLYYRFKSDVGSQYYGEYK